jgi:hypothetical protein
MRWIVQGSLVFLLLAIVGASVGIAAVMASNYLHPDPEILRLPTETQLPSQTSAPIAEATTVAFVVVTPPEPAQPTSTDVPPTQTETPAPTASATPSSSPTNTLSPTATEYVAFARITSEVGAFLRNGPGVHYETQGQADFEDVFPVVAFADLRLKWYLVELPEGQTAWVSEAVAELEGDIPLAEIALAATIPPTPTAVPSVTLTPATDGNLEKQLQEVPVLSEVTEGMRQLYRDGLEMGNRARVLAKVGDCNTVSDAFLKPFDGENYTLGTYDYLRDTIAYFQGSFARESMASEIGFNVYSVQDALWGDPQVCKSDEGPLACEYRVLRPSLSVIMFGANDILQFEADAFERYLRQIIESTMERGILPIVTTFTRRPDGRWPLMLELNMVVVRLAKEYDIPLINFWLASQYLPGRGIYADNAHLNQGTGRISFEGGEKRWGHTLRNLLTLQMLDKLRRELPMER